MNSQETLEQYFVPINLVEMWPRVQQKYEYFGFKDDINDADRYAEYVWVIEQLRKFIGKQKAETMSLVYKLEDLEKRIQEWLADGSEKVNGQAVRPMLAYIAMRNDWLQQLLFTVRYLMEVEDGTYGIE